MVFAPLAPHSSSLLSLSLPPFPDKALGLRPSPSGLLRVPGLSFSSLPFGHVSANRTINLVYSTSVLYSHSVSLCTLLFHSTTPKGYTYHKITSQHRNLPGRSNIKNGAHGATRASPTVSRDNLSRGFSEVTTPFNVPRTLPPIHPPVPCSFTYSLVTLGPDATGEAARDTGIFGVEKCTAMTNAELVVNICAYVSIWNQGAHGKCGSV